MIKRRQFIAGLGSAAALPLAAQERPSRMRRIGVLSTVAADDPDARRGIEAFLQGLAQLGWTDGRNVRLDYGWGSGNTDNIRTSAAELAALAPEVILALGGASLVGPLLQATRTVPIVFTYFADPVGAGFVESLARPGGNATGFLGSEYSISGKMVELLKRIAPSVTRVAVLRTSDTTTGVGQFGVIQAVAQALKVEVSPVNFRDAADIERGIATFARSANAGLIMAGGSALAVARRDLIVTLAARHRLPAVYYRSEFVTAGGLISYGSSMVDNCRRAAGYVDRILKGEKPADLPVQAPTKYETVINLKTAKALGLTIPETLLATADEVIQ
jgi:putative ABC transport system substrate-binding protein